MIYIITYGTIKLTQMKHIPTTTFFCLNHHQLLNAQRATRHHHHQLTFTNILFLQTKASCIQLSSGSLLKLSTIIFILFSLFYASISDSLHILYIYNLFFFNFSYFFPFIIYTTYIFNAAEQDIL